MKKTDLLKDLDNKQRFLEMLVIKMNEETTSHSIVW